MREVKLVVCLCLLSLCVQAGAQSGNDTGDHFSIVDVAVAAVGGFFGGIIVGVVSTLVISCTVYSQYCCKGRINSKSKKYVKHHPPREAEPTEIYNPHIDDGNEKENDTVSKEYEFLPVEIMRKKSKKGTAHHLELTQQAQPVAVPPPPSFPPPDTEPSLPMSPPPNTPPPPPATPVTAEPEHETVAYALPEVVPNQKKLAGLPKKKEKKTTPLAPVTVKMRQPITSIPIPPPQAAKPSITSPNLDPEQQYSASQLDAEYISNHSEHYYVMDANKLQELHEQQEISARYFK